MAWTRCISDVPGFAKQVSTPWAMRVRITLSAPFIAHLLGSKGGEFAIYSAARVRTSRQSMAYAFTRLSARGRDHGAATQALQESGVAPAGFWGIFHGLFGVASNELIVVSYGDVDHVHDAIAGVDEVVAANTLLLEPTVRPTEYAPRTREGLYVFRFFEVEHKDVDEIAALSLAAWKTFENVDAYQAEPQGLFRQQDTSDPTGRMLLCTWYDGLKSWQASRKPPATAGANFRRRHALTKGTVAYATRLLA